MKRLKCNAIFVDPDNEKHYNWLLKMKKLHLIRDVMVSLDTDNDGIVVRFTSPIKKYIIWRNNRFLGKDLVTVAYLIKKSQK